jgi:hypothetical protein
MQVIIVAPQGDAGKRYEKPDRIPEREKLHAFGRQASRQTAKRWNCFFSWPNQPNVRAVVALIAKQLKSVNVDAATTSLVFRAANKTAFGEKCTVLNGVNKIFFGGLATKQTLFPAKMHDL